MSKNRFSRSLSASARASALSTLEHFMEIKTEVPARIKHFVDYLRTPPPPRGRPEGKLKYDDEPHLIEMGRLLETGEAGNLHRAATIVAQGGQVPGQSDDATIKRLSRAFKKDEALYRSLGREEIPPA